MEFYEEPDYLRIEYTHNGILCVRYLEKQDAEMMLQFIGMKSTQHKGQLEAV